MNVGNESPRYISSTQKPIQIAARVFTPFDGRPLLTPSYRVPTIRFRDLVKAAGKPEPKSLWLDPKQDRQFMQAVKQRRVMTIVQKPGKKDFGEVGFHQQPHALYFVFPKTIMADANSKVIGITYDLVQEPQVKDPVSVEDLKKRPAKKSRLAAPPKKNKPAVKSFNVLVRREAVTETTFPVTARTKAEAKRKALETINTQPFETSKAILRTEVKHVG